MHRSNNTPVMRITPDQLKNTILPMEANQTIPPPDMSPEEEVEKKALQTIYSQLKQVRFKSLKRKQKSNDFLFLP